MASENLYTNGLPFTASSTEIAQDLLAYNLDMIKARRVSKKPTLIIVDGMSGEGKTTMTVHLADYLQGKQIEFDKQLFMGGNKFIKGLKVCYTEGLIVAIYTEAGDFGKKSTLSKLNKTLDRVFETFRTFNIVVIIDLPFMPKLDNGIFEKGIARMLVHCYARGSDGHFSVYDAERMLWLRHWATNKKVVNKQKIYGMVQPNFYGSFKDLSPARSRDLDRYCTGGKLEIIDLAEINNDGLLDYSEIAGKLNRTADWVKRKVSSLGLKPVKMYKKKAYFDESAFNALKSAVK